MISSLTLTHAICHHHYNCIYCILIKIISSNPHHIQQVISHINTNTSVEIHSSYPTPIALELKRLEVHTLRHLHLPYLLIDNTHQLHLHLLDPITVETVLATAGIPTFLASCKTGTVFFIAFCFLAGTEYFLLGLEVQTRTHYPSAFGLHAYTTAVVHHALLLLGIEAGTSFFVASLVARTNMVDFWSLLVWEAVVHVLGCKFDGRFEGVEVLLFLLIGWTLVGFGFVLG